MKFMYQDDFSCIMFDSVKLSYNNIIFFYNGKDIHSIYYEHDDILLYETFGKIVEGIKRSMIWDKNLLIIKQDDGTLDLKYGLGSNVS